MKKIALVANKNWEVDPLLHVLLSKKFRPPDLSLPTALSHPREYKPGDPPGTTPRAVFDIQGNTVEVWCIQDLMDQGASSSSSAEKMRVLPQILTGHPDAIIAFGTAGFLSDTSFNGSVVIGANAFIHNSRKGSPNPQSPWDDPRCEKELTSSFNPKIFGGKGGIDADFRLQVESKLLSPPLNPAAKSLVLAAKNYLALGAVNITDYDEYTWADESSLDAFHASGSRSPIGSVETTHGLIRLQSELPFLFISAITDRLGYFNMEVTPNEQAQNYVCAFNAGVVAAWLLPRVFGFI